MTIERVEMEIVFHCDHCPESVETGETEFTHAFKAVQREGWKAEKVGGGWEHSCPSCAEAGT